MRKYNLPEAGSHFIGLDEAVRMTELYKQEREAILLPEYKGNNILCTSETFVAVDVHELLKQAGCVGLRIYYGMKNGLEVHAILVGVNEAGEDILPGMLALDGKETGLLLEEGQRCPPLCPEGAGLLNT